MGPPGEAGNIVQFYYGCTSPTLYGRTGIPVPCNITFVGQCFEIPDMNDVTSYPPVTVTYPAANAMNGSLARVDSFFAGFVAQNPVFCYNYSVVATSALGTPVDAYIDSMLFRYFAYCAA